MTVVKKREKERKRERERERERERVERGRETFAAIKADTDRKLQKERKAASAASAFSLV